MAWGQCWGQRGGQVRFEVGTGSLECGAAVKGKRNGDARCEMRCDEIREGLRQGLTD